MFFVLPDKETETYVRLFEYTVNNCVQYQLTFSSNVISIDFEIAIHKALKIVWPKITYIKVCRFYFGQNW